MTQPTHPCSHLGLFHESTWIKQAFRNSAVFVLALAGGILAAAQSPVTSIDNSTMTPTPGAGHDYIQGLTETVNPANGSVSIRIAAPVPTERGINLPLYAYIYDTNGQYQIAPNFVANSSYPTTPYPTLLNSVNAYLGPGFYSTGGSTITGAPQSSNNEYGISAPGTVTWTTVSLQSGPSHMCSYAANYVYTDTSGGRHPLGIYYIAPAYESASACGYFGGYYAGYTSGGDESISASLNGNSPSGVYVYDNHGNQLNVAYQVEDTNGNYQNASGRPYSGTYGGADGVMPLSLTIPGLGGSYTFSYPSAATPPSPITLNVTPFAGNDKTCPSTFSTHDSSSTGNTVINLPNGQSYTISFDPNYGLVNKITYPTGATVSYTWKNNTQSDGVTFAQNGSPACSYTYDWPAVSTRIVSYDGVTPALEQDFSYSTNSGGTPYKKTTVTMKDLLRKGTPSFQTIYTYSAMPPYHTPWGPVQAGSPIPVENTITYNDITGSTLKTVTKVWSNPNIETAECVTLPSGLTSGVFYQYQGTTNLVTDKAEYDLGAITSVCQKPSTTPIRETQTTYQSFAMTPVNTYIQDRPSSIKIYSNGTMLSETDYTYDVYNTQNPLNSVSATHHDESNYGVASTTRGNATSIARACSSNCSNAVTQYGYDETGQVTSVTDPNNNSPTTYSYTDSYVSSDGTPSGNTNTYVTKITGPTTNGTSHVQTFSYGFNDGKIRSSIDENKNTTSYCYYAGGCSGSTNDPWARLTETDYPDGGYSRISYEDGGPSPSTTVSQGITGSTAKTTQTTYDAYGHAIQSTLTSDPGGSDIVATTYDGLGRVYTVSNPYRSTSDPSYGVTTYTYDGLNRKTQQSQPDGSTLQWCYDGVATSTLSTCPANASSLTKVSWVNIFDENGNHWQQASDGLGRLVSVMEPNPTSNTLSLETDYGYDALGNLLGVNQKGVSGTDTTRTRSFTYNALSRLITATNSETGQVCYGAWSGGSVGGGTCQGGYDANGNLLEKTDARGIATTYTYDALNRMLSKAYSDGTLLNCFQYDTAGTNGIGRLANEWTQTSSCPTSGGPSGSFYTLRSISAYDSMGRITSERQCTPANCATASGPQLSYGYDLVGDPTTLTNSVGASGSSLTLTTGFDAAAHMQSLVSNWAVGPTCLYLLGSTWSSGCTPSSSPYGYGAVGPLNWNLGPNLPVAQSYTNRLRVNSITATGQIP